MNTDKACGNVEKKKCPWAVQGCAQETNETTNTQFCQSYWKLFTRRIQTNNILYCYSKFITPYQKCMTRL